MKLNDEWYQRSAGTAEGKGFRRGRLTRIVTKRRTLVYQPTKKMLLDPESFICSPQRGHACMASQQWTLAELQSGQRFRKLGTTSGSSIRPPPWNSIGTSTRDLHPRQCLVSTVAIGALSGASQTSAVYPQEWHLYSDVVLRFTPRYWIKLAGK